MNVSEVDLEVIRRWAAGHPAIKQIWLFGSRARGNNRFDSDIDLAVVMQGTGDPERAYNEWSNWHHEYEQDPDLLLSKPVHLEWYEKDARLERVGSAVERDGILLYTTQ